MKEDQYPRLETRKVSELKVHLDAVRERPTDAVFGVGRSIEQFGMLRPLVLNVTTGHLLDGDVVLERLRALGAQEAPVWCVQIPEDQEDAAHLALNNHAGEWLWEKVSLALKDLQARGTPLLLTGFHESDINPLLAADWKPADKVALEDATSDAKQVGFGF